MKTSEIKILKNKQKRMLYNLVGLLASFRNGGGGGGSGGGGGGGSLRHHILFSEQLCGNVAMALYSLPFPNPSDFVHN